MINQSVINPSEWANSLIVDYPSQNIIILRDEEKWQSWAAELTKSSIFSNSSIPNPHSFVEWRDWAKNVYAILQ